MHVQINPILKWVGGKRSLLDVITENLPNKWNNYHEPFFGGGALYCHLFNLGLLDKKEVYLSDANKELMETYFFIKGMQSLIPELLAKLDNLAQNHNKENYYKIRDLDKSKSYKKLPRIDKVARFIYLNKTCFNGLCRYNSKGEFNAPIGDKVNPVLYAGDDILNLCKALWKTFLFQSDFELVLKNAKKKDFVYFDPPYYPISKTSNFTGYISNFQKDEQTRLFKVYKELSDRGVYVMESNSNSDFIKELYKGFNIKIIHGKRSISANSNSRGVIKELLITNY